MFPEIAFDLRSKAQISRDSLLFPGQNFSRPVDLKKA
jgi:hypothetical protein